MPTIKTGTLFTCLASFLVLALFAANAEAQYNETCPAVLKNYLDQRARNLGLKDGCEDLDPKAYSNITELCCRLSVSPGPPSSAPTAPTPTPKQPGLEISAAIVALGLIGLVPYLRKRKAP